jgi:hypothetical protein
MYHRPPLVVLHDGLVIAVGPYKEVVKNLYHIDLLYY